ncbi:thiamine pyrophosphokinase, catalytic domain containing protein [Trichomonas vaginalis G3]|uniref:Thiamin pyrophosphokinase, catalytic domain containing protein n=1 Tax=Trichomonas vaginalis (strain ATCC PRA-98 / G3) TaxID=412133 RepID=A2FHA9_TRIV3|nr:thiamine pyrophosphokinase family [Trichomonas vaginalis G3]EAX95706.1 thiamine pyrophosphokinase, catalytic domain containing protein [Trichomonas vaginalis G3]KAI5491199.1 thiamine pyrophosphokinase family [Trichomonas vaginalis G3]|eukprot:XP_001308636.1 Thiamin pyrophosphokinase, catalytic domain containing protein [Trichomonas vaginalis G3]
MIVSNPLEQGLPFAAVALNNSLPKYFDSVWKNANIRVCVDGGSNRVLDYFVGKKEKKFLSPDVIVGDLQSIRPEVQHEFESTGSQIVKINNSQVTDAEKAINLLSDMKYKNTILLLGAFGGRFDQTAAMIHAALARPDMNIILADDSNFSHWVFPGKTKILTPQICTTHVCGLIPLLKPVCLKTEGFRWNLDWGTLTMGEFISSSNEVAAPEVSIETRDPIFWTIQAKKVVEIQKSKQQK